MFRAKYLFIAVFFIICTLLQATSQTNCIEKLLELRVENADVISSGVIRKIDRNHSDRTYEALVELNHVTKGAAILNSHFNMSFDKKDLMLTKSINEADTWKNLVIIKNFGSSICESNVKPGDVRIFFLKSDLNSKEMTINSSLIQITPVKTQNFEIISSNFNLNFTKCKVY